jgi:protein SCO1/2
MSPIRLLLAIVSLLAVAIGGWLSYRIVSPPPLPEKATVLPRPIGLPEFSLVDQNGEAFTRSAFRDRWSVVFFGFTHCPDVCPLTLQALASARRQLADAGQAPLPHIVLISVDPERDTPAVIGEYVRYFDADVTGVTGGAGELRKLTDGLGIFFQRSGAESGEYLVDHSAVVLVIGPEARFRALFSTPHRVEDFVNDLPLIVAGR